MNRFRVGQKVKYSLKKDAVGIVEQILFVRGTKRVNYLIKYSDEKKQEAQFRYLNSPKGAKNTRFEQLKNITKNLLKIETKRMV